MPETATPTPDERPKLIHGYAFGNALISAGVIRADDRVRRIVVDAQVDSVVTIHVERYGDDRLLKVVPTLEGVEITTVSRDEQGEGET
jgi:hypothetical protein